MFEGSYKKFICDNCGAEKFVKIWPAKWVCLKRGGQIIHYCFVCAKPEEVEEMEADKERVKKFNPSVKFVN